MSILLQHLYKARNGARELAARRAMPWALDKVLFGPQLAFARDDSTFGVAVCSRRAGKSIGCSAWLLDGPLVNPKAPSLYFTITRGSAQRIIWNALLEMNMKYGLGYEPNHADLILKRGGRGMVYLTGVDNRSEIEKIRGTGWGRAVGDEAQTLPEYMRDLVNDILMPSFMDHGGRLRMIGTPGAVPAGYFYEISHKPQWSRHHWTVWDNPHIPEERKHLMLRQTLDARGVDISHPSIRREWFGEWAFDPDALVFRFDPSKNVFGADLKTLNMVDPWQYVIGIDLGFDDADAIAVLAFNRGHPAVFLVEEHVLPKQTITPLANRLKELHAQYRPMAMVVDQGGLGKKIAEEVNARTGLPLQAAEKQRKFEYIELLNDAMRTGRFYAKPGSQFGHDAMKVEWDRDKSVGEKRVISNKFHSDICDAVLYAFRESMHWAHKEKPYVPPVGTPEWAKLQERTMFENAQKEVRQMKKEYRLGEFGSEMTTDWGAMDDDWGLG